MTARTSNTTELDMEINEKMNGDLSKVKDTEILFFSPKPQRVPRLNRRGFLMSSDDHNNSATLEQKLTGNSTGTENNKNPSAKSALCQETTKFKSPISSEKKIINLSSKSSTPSQSSLKRNSDTLLEKCSEDTPSKKAKHKPITWP